MKKYIISQNSISYQEGKMVLVFPVNKEVPGYDSRTNNFTQPFVADVEGRLYRIKPEGSISSEDGRYIFIQAQKPDRPMNYAEIVGWTIRSARIEAGLSCKEVADRVGIKTLTIEKIELGRFTMNVLLLGRLAEAIGMEVSLTPRKTIPSQDKTTD